MWFQREKLAEPGLRLWSDSNDCSSSPPSKKAWKEKKNKLLKIFETTREKTKEYRGCFLVYIFYMVVKDSFMFYDGKREIRV